MGGPVQQIISTLTTFPGNLAYHLVLAFAVTGALFVSLNHWRDSEFPQGRRMVIGLGLLLAVRLLFFIATGFAWQGIAPTHQFFPLLDRAVTILSLVIIISLWVFPESSRTSNVASALLTIITLIFLAFSLANWQTELLAWARRGFENQLMFNQSNFLRTSWELYALVLVFTGTLLLVIRRPNNWGTGLAMLAILFAGHLFELFFPDFTNDYPGTVRLAQLAAYPILFTLPNRFPLHRTSTIPADLPPLTVERRSYSTESETFRAFLTLSTETDSKKICEAFTRTVANLLLADVCFLITLVDEQEELIFECGYDLIREQSFPGTAFDERVMPVLCAALRRERTLKLPASSTSPDLLGLAQALGIERVGHLIAVPIPRSDRGPIQGVVLLSPYSNRAWNFDDENYLKEASDSLGELARQRYEQAEQIEQVEVVTNDLLEAQQEAESAQQEILSLQSQLLTLEAQGMQDPSAAESIAALLTAQEKAEETIHELENQIEELQMQHETTMSRRDHEGSIPSGDDGYSLGNETDGSIDGADPATMETIASITSDLHQPLASILGYTDLLLSEPVGILGTLQVKFLERIKASIERIQSMTDELVEVADVDPGIGKFQTEPVDLTSVIDDAIAFTRSQLQDKSIVLRVNLPDQLPELTADRDALQQILIHLLQNAGSASPTKGEIALRARVQKNGHAANVILQVSDTGGGIPDADLPRVFSRLYLAEKTQIPGIGETGIGLAIAKTLVEAQNGTIWVDTQPGTGSTFSFSLPLGQSLANEENPGGPEL
jgi:signal transduction histidine kinase